MNFMLHRVNTKVVSVQHLANYSEGVTSYPRVLLQQLIYTARNLPELLLTSISPHGVTPQTTISSHKITTSHKQNKGKPMIRLHQSTTQGHLPVTMITQDCVQPVWLSDCRVGAITAG
jgi:hypothetical protein